MNELALFAGGGGGLLASHLLGWTTAAAVERDPRAREILFARQRDGYLPQFPIWDDVHTFDPAPWGGQIDVVSGGFPCQAFSSAARGRNNAPDLWPEMRRIVQGVAPAWVFAENVRRAPIDRARSDLLALGFKCSPPIEASAAALGAPHIRERWWLVAHAHGHGESVGTVYEEARELPSAANDVWSARSRGHIRLANGLARRVERVRAAGNGQVPIVAAAAWRLGVKLLAADH